MINTNKSLTSVIEAPNRNFEPRQHHLFLAGGITNCPDWQSEMVQDLNNYPNLNIFNPRRSSYPMNDPSEAVRQITWEYDYLKSATAIAMWFSRGSINPIVLYELGRWVNSRPKMPAFIGTDDEYIRTSDVMIQTGLDRPELEVVTSLDALTDQVKLYIASQDRPLCRARRRMQRCLIGTQRPSLERIKA